MLLKMSLNFFRWLFEFYPSYLHGSLFRIVRKEKTMQSSWLKTWKKQMAS